MSFKNILLIAMSTTLVSGQRGSFAGTRPIGYPEIITTSTEGLGNRFGEDDISTTTMRLPLEANGDRNLVDRLSKLPVDQQPFWLINWLALEEHRKNPQTFEQKPNVFVDPMSSSGQQSQQGTQQQATQQQSTQQRALQQLMQQQAMQQQLLQQQSSQRLSRQDPYDLQQMGNTHFGTLQQWPQRSQHNRIWRNEPIF